VATKKSKVQKSVKEFEVQISLVHRQDGKIKQRRRKLQIVKTLSNARKDDLLKQGIEQHAKCDKNFDATASYNLLYSDFSPVNEPFDLH